MAQWKDLVIAAGASALVLSGCARSESCERGRMSLDRMWETAQTQAAELKLASVEASSPRPTVWTTIESDLELLQSAFATEQITWESAKKKADQLQRAIQDLGMPSTSSAATVRESIARAATMQSELERSCRY
jgi:ribosomal protein L29